MPITFDEFYKKYSAGVYEHFKRKEISTFDADDLFQEVCLKVYISIKNNTNIHNFKHWLSRVTTNTIIDWKRTKRCKYSLEDLVAPENETKEEQEQKISAIREQITDLPAQYQEAIRLRYEKGLDLQEVREQLDISYTNAKIRIFRGLQKLKKKLAV